MSFNSWAKRLMISEIESEGYIAYNKEGWFCATPTGFLLHVQFEKIPYGYFRIQYNIMPLVAPLNEDYTGVHMNMGADRDAGDDYLKQIDIPLFERPEFKSKEYESSETCEICVAVIRRYLNPLFKKIDSLQNYCLQCIRDICDSVYDSHSLQRRDEIAKDFFLKGHSDGVEKPAIWNTIAAPDYPWYTGHINGMPFVYAALGKYKEALAWMQDQYKSYRMDKTSSLLNKAMHENNVEECNAILDSIYRNNRMAIKKALGLTPPDSWR